MKKPNGRIVSIILCAALLIPAVLFDKIAGFFPVYVTLYALAWLAAARTVIVKAARNIRRGVIFDENFLMLIASIGAFVINLVFSDYETELCAPGGGEVMMDGVLVMLLYQIGEHFQSMAVKKSRKGIKQLLSMRPDSAVVVRGGEEIEVFPDEVEPGELIAVKPGERVAIDGVVESGASYVDSSAITGESEPRYCRAGDEIKSGSIAVDGLITVRTTKPFGESTASKMLRLVEEASEKKAKQETFITRFAKVYTPIVCAIALLVAVVPPLAIMLAGGDNEWSHWIYTALSLLVVSCPCALVISVPLTFFGGIGGAAKAGVLIKGADVFSPYMHATVAAFDKTGTITEGKFSVVECTLAEKDLALVAAAESRFTHPIARSVTAYYTSLGDETPACEHAEDVAGKGIKATVGGVRVIVGKAELLEECGVKTQPCDGPFTALHAAADGRYLGHIVVADKIKPGSAQAVAELKKAGVKTVMLTGDRYEVAEAVAREAGVDEFYAGLLPEDKVAKVAEMQNRGEKVLFCGDGINDAPVLAAADVGCAMGGLGSDAAIEAGDAVVMNDDLSAVVAAKKHARKVIAIAMQNIVGSLLIKTAIMILAIALPDFPLWVAIIGDVGVCLVAIVNAMRALGVKKRAAQTSGQTKTAASGNL